jgi:hypothetical protein
MATSRARPIKQPSVENLPPYFGFGTLDPESARFDGERLTARYQYADGSTAYQVDWQPGRCRLEAQFAGEMVSISEGRDLQSTLFQSFLDRAEPGADPRFVDLSHRVVVSGNIYFQFPAPSVAEVLATSTTRPGSCSGCACRSAGRTARPGTGSTSSRCSENACR